MLSKTSLKYMLHLVTLQYYIVKLNTVKPPFNGYIYGYKKYNIHYQYIKYNFGIYANVW